MEIRRGRLGLIRGRLMQWTSQHADRWARGISLWLSGHGAGWLGEQVWPALRPKPNGVCKGQDATLFILNGVLITVCNIRSTYTHFVVYWCFFFIWALLFYNNFVFFCSTSFSKWVYFCEYHITTQRIIRILFQKLGSKCKYFFEHAISWYSFSFVIWMSPIMSFVGMDYCLHKRPVAPFTNMV